MAPVIYQYVSAGTVFSGAVRTVIMTVVGGGEAGARVSVCKNSMCLCLGKWSLCLDGVFGCICGHACTNECSQGFCVFVFKIM